MKTERPSGSSPHNRIGFNMQPTFASLCLGLLSLLAVVSHVAAVPGAAVDCHKIECPAVKCGLGEFAEIPDGACCPVCVPCRVACPLAPCPKPAFVAGQCCGVCQPNCEGVPCPKCFGPIEDGNCCPTCGGE
ncbi:hypothetical protein R3P38DRAFT_3146986 [Favolaschia claudopus]|uniref:Uncharacterized protein n=1 Tax=Favolaschia claudopus TaxID=2862362 RepID=A0AAV9Z2L6_9AGAR